MIKTELEMAKEIHAYLGGGSLPKTLIDDRRDRIDSSVRTEDDVILAHYREDSLFSIKTARFLKDFPRYNAIPDLQTPNASFLRTAEIFRKQGIKNYYFILQLNNPALRGVDPYDENLTSEQKLMIMEECKGNFWYFLREVCKLRHDTFFRANRGNISFIWTYLNHMTTYMIMPRQQGKYQRNSNKVRVKQLENAPVNELSGWKQIGDLRIGDILIDRYGKETNVIGIHPGGVKRLYRLTFSDGRSTEAGAEHLWTVYEEGEGNNGEGLWVDKTTAALIADMRKGIKIRLPLIEPEQGMDRPLKVDAYEMGCLFTKENNSAIKTQFGLPVVYLEAGLEDRRKLLQAFLEESSKDTRGRVFKSANNVLNNQLVYLIRGLGGTALKDKDEVVFTLPEDENNMLYLDTVVYSGDDNVTCIEVDNQDHLYITDDFILTHNTVSVQVINFWLTYIVGRGYKSHVITLKSDNRAQFIDAVKRIRASLPKYLLNTTYKDKDAGTYLNYKAFGEEMVNTLTISVPQIGRDAAGDLGRGLTVGTTNLDEPSYIRWIEEIINGCSPSALTEMENCRNAGEPYGINYITTPNTTLHPSGEFMFKKLMDATEWREKFFDSMSESHLKERLLKASPTKTTSPAISMVYNYLQLGKNKEWVRETIDLLNLSLSKAKIDLLLMWTEDGEDRVFDDVTREAINNVKRDKVWSKEYRSSGLFVDFFVTQEEVIAMGKKEYNDFFVIGVDTSSAINKDACTLIIRSSRTGKVVGVGRYPLAFLDDVTAIIVDMLVVLENSVLVIERNYAHHMIDNLLIMLPAKGLDPFTRIYNTVYQDPVNNQKELEAVQNVKFQHRTKNFYLKYKQHFGFNTTAKSREVLYGLLQEAVGVTGYGVCYDKLADELINLKTKGDRIDHDSKQHDDLVIAWLLSYWFIKLGANKPYYGIQSGIALTDTRNLLQAGKNDKVSEVDQSVVDLVNNVRGRLQKLTDELLNTNDNVLALRLEAEIHKLSRLLPPETKKLLTIDSLIEDAKVERSRRILHARKTA